MKNFIEYFVESNHNRVLYSIDAEIINEALQDQRLLKIAKICHDCGNKRKSFKNLFGSYNYAWDKITESDWVSLEGDKGIDQAKKELRKMIQYKTDGLMIIYDKDDNIKYIIDPNSDIIDPSKKTYIYMSEDREKSGVDYRPEPTTIVNGHKERQYTVLNYLDEASKIDYLNLNKFKTYKLRVDRREDKEGIVYNTPEYYETLAKQNMERYKKIIAQNKAKKAAKEDTISQDVYETIANVMDLTTKLAAEPIKYADQQFNIKLVVEMCYNRRTWDNRSGRSNGFDGLLPMFNSYLSNHVELSKSGGYEFQRKEYDTIKNNIKNMIDKINKKIDEINEKL